VACPRLRLRRLLDPDALRPIMTKIMHPAVCARTRFVIVVFTVIALSSTARAQSIALVSTAEMARSIGTLRDPASAPADLLEAISRIGDRRDAVEDLLDQLARTDVFDSPHEFADYGEVRAAARAALERQGIAVVAVLRDQLSERSPQRRATAAAALGNLGSLPEEAVDRLADHLDDPASEVRFAAVFALLRSKQSTDWVVNRLAQRVSGDTTSFQLVCVECLGVLGKQGWERLQSLFRQSAPAVRLAIIRGVRHRYLNPWAGPRDHPVDLIDLLCAALTDSDHEVREEALAALGALGVDATPAIPTLADRRWTDDSENVEAVLGEIAADASARGISMAGTLPRILRVELGLAIASFFAWLILVCRFRAAWMTRGRRLALAIAPSCVFVAVTAWCILGKSWLQRFLPADVPGTLVSVRLSVPLSLALACGIVAALAVVALGVGPPLQDSPGDRGGGE
jgi:HEAT repeat protein